MLFRKKEVEVEEVQRMFIKYVPELFKYSKEDLIDYLHDLRIWDSGDTDIFEYRGDFTDCIAKIVAKRDDSIRTGPRKKTETKYILILKRSFKSPYMVTLNDVNQIKNIITGAKDIYDGNATKKGLFVSLQRNA